MSFPAERFADPSQIAEAVSALARRIDRDHADADPVMVGVLKGCMPFLADLSRAMQTTPVIDFLAVSRFGDEAKQGGVVRILKDLDEEVRGRPVVIVEDIVDTGLTPSYLRRLLAARAPSSLRLCGLLDRRAARTGSLSVEYAGFEAPQGYLVGYGLDLDEDLRDLRSLWLLHDVEAFSDPEMRKALRERDRTG
ncbi:MAG: hypoxanthine phosphoribosyltransferase [Actinomycetota bacterium]